MIYAKPALTVEQQADQLIARGLQADRQELIRRLQAVSYYRLSGYLHPYRLRDDSGSLTDQFRDTATLEKVWRCYNFDRRLRMIILDAIERIEVAVRTRFVYHFVHSKRPNGQSMGPFGHLDAAHLPGFQSGEHQKWLDKIREEHRRSRELFVEHFDQKYGDHHGDLPLWMACEVMTCGAVHKFANCVPRAIVRQVAEEFEFADRQLLSWIKALFALRNACAHHSRVWNRTIGAKPSLPSKSKKPDWHAGPAFPNDRVGFMLTVCHVWLAKISPTSEWRTRLFTLFDEYPEVSLLSMGLPRQWREHPLWA